MKNENKHYKEIVRLIGKLTYSRDKWEVFIKRIQDIKPPDIYSAFERTKGKHDFTISLRSFFRYLHETEQITIDLSIFVPSKRKSRPVPSVFTKSEVEKFLLTFDTETKIGKRDYAITLLRF